MKRGFGCIFSSASRRFSVFTSGIFFLLIPSFAYSVPSGLNQSADYAISPYFISAIAPDFVLTLAGSVVVILILVIYFLSKLRKANRQLRERNKQIEEINLDLQKANKDLSKQKEAITREYSYSEIFYRMLIQSADDGISFYDRDWNLKFANDAFYKVIGMDKARYDAAIMSELEIGRAHV